MKDQKFGRKTSPGFGDPRGAVRAHAEAPPVATRGSVLVGQPPAQRAPHTDRPPFASSAAQRASIPASHSVSPQRRGRAKPLVEIEVLRERTRSPRPDPYPGCYEIWTQNHVYSLDARLRCVEVRTPQTNQPRLDHPFLGGRLVGGQAQEEAMEMSHPLPRPGAFAVFELRKKNRRQFVRTSPVDRVVLRLRIVTIADGADAPPWEDVVDEDDS